MKPVSSKVNDHPSKKGCNPINAACVVWEGPDIPCIKLCKGDTIDKVIYDLAKILCEITDDLLDVSTLEFGCLIEDGSCEPKTILETLQALIYKACESNPTIINESTQEPILMLPQCLYYQNNENDTVTQLILSEYVTYLASKICEILLSISSINTAITNLNNRINEIETILETIGSGSGSAVINITTRCLSFSSVPGEVLPIEVAFQNLESALCSYIDTLGEISDWQSTFSNVCISSTTELPCGEGTYGSLPNWIANPLTAADTVNNLWVALCAVNNCVEEASSGSGNCVQLQPASIDVTTSNVQAFINIGAPLIPAGFENPTNYTINVYQNNLGSPGTLVTTYTAPYATGSTAYQVLAGAPLVEDTEYYIEVIAKYSCGSSPAIFVISKIITGLVLFELEYSTTDSPVIGTCNLTPTGLTDREVTVTLIDLNTMSPTLWGGITPCVVTLRVIEETCLGTNISLVPVSITPGATSGSATIRIKDVQSCGGNCTVLLSAVQCVDNIDYAGVSNVAPGSSMPPFC